jgi:hypothetical protein
VLLVQVMNNRRNPATYTSHGTPRKEAPQTRHAMSGVCDVCAPCLRPYNAGPSCECRRLEERCASGMTRNMSVPPPGAIDACMTVATARALLSPWAL